MGKSGKKLPLLKADDFLKVVQADGWKLVAGTKHLALEHPTKTGKVSIDEKWDRCRPGGWVFRSVLHQAGLSRAEFERIYWQLRGKG